MVRLHGDNVFTFVYAYGAAASVVLAKRARFLFFFSACRRRPRGLECARAVRLNWASHWRNGNAISAESKCNAREQTEKRGRRTYTCFGTKTTKVVSKQSYTYALIHIIYYVCVSVCFCCLLVHNKCVWYIAFPLDPADRWAHKGLRLLAEEKKPWTKRGLMEMAAK